jgi:hypothetical protein
MFRDLIDVLVPIVLLIIAIGCGGKAIYEAANSVQPTVQRAGETHK